MTFGHITMIVIIPIVFQTFGEHKMTFNEENEVTIRPIQDGPMFPGGVDSLMSFIEKNLKRHPSDPRGKVFVQFVVNTDGRTSDFEVLRGLNKDCDERVLQVLMKMPKWKPAMQNNIPIRQRYVIPVEF